MRIETVTSSLSQGLEQDTLDAIIGLARDAACSLTDYPVSEDSPFAHLAKAQVEGRLRADLKPFSETVEVCIGEVRHEAQAGLVLAWDDSAPEQETLVGFINFNPYLLSKSTASIGVIVVSRANRGMGVMTKMLNAARKLHPVLVLDCALPLVRMYRDQGFCPNGCENAHVSMSTGKIEGRRWDPEGPSSADSEIVAAKRYIQETLGAEVREATAALEAKVQVQKQRVLKFLRRYKPQCLSGVDFSASEES